MILPLYRVATTFVAPLIRLYLMVRRWRGKEDGERLEECFGRQHGHLSRGYGSDSGHPSFTSLHALF